MVTAAGPRITPYELALPGREFVEGRFGQISEEAEARRADPGEPATFVNLAAAGAILQEIRPEGEDPELIHQHGILLYHAFHFWRAGEPFYLLEPQVARFLVEAAPGRDRSPEPPAPAGYVQLPRHLFWAPGDEGAPPEPLDGIFWTLDGDGTLRTLVPVGVRRDRPGFTVLPLPPAPVQDSGAWLVEGVREGGRDFETHLPGGELDRLYSVEAAGEVLKLLARFFWYQGSFPGAVGPPEPPAEGDAAGDEGLPSRLPCRRVTLVDRDRPEAC